MKSVRKLFAAVATAAALTGAGQAQAVLLDWYLDSDGAGAGAATEIGAYVDLSGKSYVHNTFTSATTFTFNEAATFASAYADSDPIGSTFAQVITSTFIGSGSGTIGATGGSLSFTNGVLQLKSGATLIGTFDLLAGSAALNAGGVLPNGDISLVFKAISLAPGYFFKDSSLTTDLSTLVSDPAGLLFGFATTNAKPADSTKGLSDLVALYNTAFDPDSAASAPNGVTDLYLNNGGQFALEIPEPGSLALTGLALGGLVFASRRRKAS